MDLVQDGFPWKKLVLQQQKIRLEWFLKKKQANVDIVAGMMLFLILVVTLFFGFRMTQYMITAAGVEDALAASNLASAVIDLEEYGKSNIIFISNEERAFTIFRESLLCNLKLDEELNTTNRSFLIGQVHIEEYRIYNVRKDQVDISIFNNEGEVISRTTGEKGKVWTPDNTLVETTTIYSRITFKVEGLCGQELWGEKEKSIDIARCNSE